MKDTSSKAQPSAADLLGIRISHWRQYRGFHLDLSAPVTILAGANATGKTTLLSLIAMAYGWEFRTREQLELPRNARHDSALRGEFSRKRQSSGWNPIRLPELDAKAVATVELDGDKTCGLIIPDGSPPVLSEMFASQGSDSPGLLISAYREEPMPTPLGKVPQHWRAESDYDELFLSEMNRRYRLGWNRPSPILQMRRALVSWSREASHSKEAADLIGGFRNLLHALLPDNYAMDVHVTDDDVEFFGPRLGRFRPDTAAGGLLAIVDIAWQVYVTSMVSDRFVVLMDEPEGHMHPELQRVLLPSLARQFPQAQFVVATHSPQIASSCPNATTYALQHKGDRVTAHRVGTSSDWTSSDGALREILGLETTMPIWAEHRVAQLMNEVRSEGLTAEGLEDLYARMAEQDVLFALPDVLAGRKRGASQ